VYRYVCGYRAFISILEVAWPD